MPTDPPTFGVPAPGHHYHTRLSAYAVVRDEVGRVATVKTPRGHYLPGGGLEPLETVEAALSRECFEECGFGIEIGARIGDAVQYLDLPAEGHFRIVGSFFLAKFTTLQSSPSEPDHDLVWLPIEEAASSMRRPFEAWAIRKAAADS